MIKYYPVWLKGMATIIHYTPEWLSGVGRLLPFAATQYLEKSG